MIHALTDHLLARWPAVTGGRWPRPQAIHWLRVGRIGDLPRPVTYFYLFLDDESAPAMVAKITLEHAARARLEHTFDVTRCLRNRVGEPLAATIPAPLAEFPFGAYWVGIEEAASGRPVVPVVALARRGEEARVRRYIGSVVDWLIAFGRTGYALVDFDGDLYTQAVTEPLARLARMHELAPPESRQLAAIETQLGAHRGRPVPAVAQHGDPWPGNIFVDGDRLQVIDWDRYREQDASCHDIYTFFSSFIVRGGRRAPGPPASAPEDPFAATIHADTWFAHLVRAELARYVAAIGFDPGLAALMMPMYLVRMAVRRDPATVSGRSLNAKFAGLLAAHLRAITSGSAPGDRHRQPVLGRASGPPAGGPSRSQP